nr:hypothetical protein [Streptococcus hyointestinalis]
MSDHLVVQLKWSYQNKDGVFSHYDKKYSDKVISEFEKARDKDDSIVTSTYISPTPSTKGANKGLYKGVYFYEKALEKTENARILGMIKIKKCFIKMSLIFKQQVIMTKMSSNSV